MKDNSGGPRRAVLYTPSGGFVSVAFALLGASAAEAETIPGEASGAPLAKDTALKAASAVPGMGAIKAVDATRKGEERPAHRDRTTSAPAAPRSVPGPGAACGFGHRRALGIEVEWTKRRSKTSCSAAERQEWT